MTKLALKSNAGPNVEAQYEQTTLDWTPAKEALGTQLSIPTQATLHQMETCLFPTGDLFFNADLNPGLKNWSEGSTGENLFDSQKAYNASKRIHFTRTIYLHR